MTTGNLTNIVLLGPVSVQLSNGKAAEFPTQKAKALLAILALAGQAGIDRDEAAALLWSRSPQAQARTNLRQALAGLRNALGPDAERVESEGQRIALSRRNVEVDVDALFDGTLSVQSVVKAGQLLEGTHLNEPAYDTWLAGERTRMTEAVKSDLLRRGDSFLDDRAFDQALAAARRLIELDEFFEAAYRLEMRALQGSGENAAALNAYVRLKKILQRELSVEPSQETELLRQTIQGGYSSAEQAAENDSATKESSGIEKPTIAVRPFDNLSGDPAQGYLSQGFTQDLITELSRLTLLSVSVLRGGDIENAAQRGYGHLKRDFGIHFVLEGSVRRAGDRVRVTVQLIEARGGKAVRAENYDRDLEDIFKVQTDVARSIATAIPGRVMQAVAEQAARKAPANIKAYEYYLLGRSIRDSFSAETVQMGREYFQKAIEADERYAKAYGLLADTYFVDVMMGFADDETAQKCYDLQVKSVELDASDVMLQEGMGFAYVAKGMWGEASAQFDRASSLIRHEAEQLMWCGYGMMMCGRHQDAVRTVRRSMDMDPLHPPSFEWVYGQTLFFDGRAEDALSILRGDALLNSLAYACQVASLVETGNIKAAKTALEDFKRTRLGEFESRRIDIVGQGIEAFAGGYRAMLRASEDWERLASGLRAAGLGD